MKRFITTYWLNFVGLIMIVLALAWWITTASGSW